MPVLRRRAAVEFFNVRMVIGFGEHASNGAPLSGHFQTFLDAQTLDAAFHLGFGSTRDRRNLAITWHCALAMA